ncbi:MAG TPA: hypothetical protein PKB14_11960 [Rubrivivax sp.]|nr:hypothetical protein [Rubrivivax sp.]
MASTTKIPYLKFLAFGVVITIGQTAAVAQTAQAVTPQQVCVTNGVISTQRDQSFIVESPSSRAVVKPSDDNFGAIEFEYLGPTTKEVPLDSGRMVHQLGLKLHARDSCNVIYVMWSVEADTGFKVTTKTNPSKSTNRECGTDGYKMIYQSKPGDIPPVKIGEPRRLEASLRERTLTVKIDGNNVWQGEVGVDSAKAPGYSGIRTDNVRARFRWFATPPTSDAVPSVGDEPRAVCKPVVAAR